MKGSDVESITKLLKAHGVKLSAVRANRLLMEIGLLEEATRDSATRPGVVKTYKVVTERGLDFGVNEENPQSPGQSSPYWYRDSFAELAALLVAADEAPPSGDAAPTSTAAPASTEDVSRDVIGSAARTSSGAAPGEASPDDGSVPGEPADPGDADSSRKRP